MTTCNYQNVFNLSNKSSIERRIWIEPWAEELLLPPQVWWRFVFEAKNTVPMPIPIEIEDEMIVIYGIVDSTLRVYHDDLLVWESYALFNPPS